MHKARFARPLLPLLLAPAVAACGGGGGSAPGPVTPSAVLPPPVVTPPTPAPASPFDTAEYRRSTAATPVNVLPAWDRGLDGRGVTMGFVDSGIDATSAEFAGRIHPASRDVSGQGRGIQDVSGHGTSTVAVAAAARNDSGIVGVAPAATLAILRADNGQCTPGCSYNDPAIAAGVDAAVAAGARVISLSLGGGTPTAQLRTAFARATSAGTVLVLSAGNDSSGEIGGFPAGALAAAGPAAVIVAGAMDGNRQIADFSNRAGSAQNNFIVAPGVELRTFNHTGAAILASGTSYSAPIVAAAIALLAQAWPELPASRLVTILFESADDAGAPGVDPVYGRGVLNIGRALRPAGPTMLAGTSAVVPLGANGVAGPAFGDSLRAGSGLSAVTVLDRHGRDYVVPLGRSIGLPPAGRLAARLGGEPVRRLEAGGSAGAFGLALAVSAPSSGLAPAGADPFRAARPLESHLGLAHRGVDPRAGERGRPGDARLVVRQGALALTMATGRLADDPLPGAVAGGLVARDASEGLDLPAERLLAGLSWQRGDLRLGMAASRAEIRLAETFGLSRTARSTRLSAGAAVSRWPLIVAAQAALTDEAGAWLGTRLAPAFGLRGGHGLEAGGSVTLEAGGFDLRVAVTGGWHHPRIAPGGLLAPDGAVGTLAWSIAGSAPLAGGRVSARIAGPPAVVGGGLRLANGAPLELAPSARETAAELGYARGPLALSAFTRANAGHRPGLQDRGVALRWSQPF